MRQEDKRTFSITDFMRAWGPLILIIGALTWGGLKDKIAGGLPQLSQAVACQQGTIAKQQESISKLETFKEVQNLRNSTYDKKLDEISGKLETLLRRIPPSDKYTSGGDDRSMRSGQ
jgi:hypothetical protein